MKFDLQNKKVLIEAFIAKLKQYGSLYIVIYRIVVTTIRLFIAFYIFIYLISLDSKNSLILLP